MSLNPTATSTWEVLPAGSLSSATPLHGAWLSTVFQRIVDLGRRPEGWDSYGARELSDEAVSTVVEFLEDYGSAIQTAPHVSLTVEGGLSLEWVGANSSIEVSSEPDQPLMVLFEDNAAGVEREMPARECSLLEKWLWQASSTV